MNSVTSTTMVLFLSRLVVRYYAAKLMLRAMEQNDTSTLSHNISKTKQPNNKTKIFL